MEIKCGASTIAAISVPCISAASASQRQGPTVVLPRFQFLEMLAALWAATRETRAETLTMDLQKAERSAETHKKAFDNAVAVVRVTVSKLDEADAKVPDLEDHIDHLKKHFKNPSPPPFL